MPSRPLTLSVLVSNSSPMSTTLLLQSNGHDSVRIQMEDWPDHSPLSFSPSSSSSGPTREPCMGCTRDVSDEAGSVHIKFQRA